MYVNICICTIAQWPERRWCYPDDGFLSSDSLASRHGVRLQAVDAHLPPHKLLVKPAVLAHPPCYPQLPPAPPTLPCLHNTNQALSAGTLTNHVYGAKLPRDIIHTSTRNNIFDHSNSQRKREVSDTQEHISTYAQTTQLAWMLIRYPEVW